MESMFSSPITSSIFYYSSSNNLRGFQHSPIEKWPTQIFGLPTSILGTSKITLSYFKIPVLTNGFLKRKNACFSAELDYSLKISPGVF